MLRCSLIILSILLFIIFSFNTFVLAFHDGGVTSCKECHIIHNSQDGEIVTPNSPDGNQYILKEETPSDVCLSCHDSQNGSVFSDDPLNPSIETGAGNFVFLLEDNINDSPNGINTIIPGSSSGHSIIAPSRGVISDPNYLTGPGGSFPSSDLGCTSCHDPHGNNNYRMLYGNESIQNGSYFFQYDAPLAVGIDFNNSVESNSNHNAYLSGMSEWCGNCHGQQYHNSNISNFGHDSPGEFENDFIDRYNLYNGTNDPNGGTPTNSYLAEVPFEETSNTTNRTHGPTNSSNVFCLSCHRAHASSSPSAGRWDFNVDDLQEDGTVSGSYPIPNPYSNSQQDPLCAKCHQDNVEDNNDVLHQ